MRTTTVTNGSQTISSPIVLDTNNVFGTKGLALVVTGTNTSDVEYSLDDPWATYATDYNTNAAWFKLSGGTGLTASTQIDFAKTARAIRLNTTSYTSGSAKLTVVEPSIT